MSSNDDEAMSNEMEVDQKMELMEVKDDDEGSDDEESSDDEEEEEEGEAKTYLPGVKLEEGEELEIDEQAYVVYHQASLGPPCLSFDLLPELSQPDFPLSITAVAGTQANKVTANSIIVFRMSNMHSVKPVEDDEEEEEEKEEEKPVMRMAGIRHSGCVNRVRYSCIGPTPVVAAWAESGTVSVFNLAPLLERLDLPGKENKEVVRDDCSPLQTFAGHKTEGFALDWSSVASGSLATGDCSGGIHVWKPGSGGTWSVSEKSYASHTASVEDVRWSPNEANVLVSCSCDKSLKVWDVRADPSKACMLTQANAHASDVNVIDWNPNDPFIVSGGDDGLVKIWDLRNFGSKSEAVATFAHHTAPVTCVEWHREDSTVLASGGEDHQVAQWDLAVERDQESEAATDEGGELSGLPPQLLFIHQGMRDVKELHWHAKIPGLLVATSHTGFDVFRTISV